MTETIPEHMSQNAEWDRFNSLSNFLQSATALRLSSESYQPVSKFVGRFTTTSNATFYVSSKPPGLFTSISTIEASFNTWINFPVPTLQQHSDIRQAYSSATKRSPHQSFSIAIFHSSCRIHVPHWVLSLWDDLRNLLSCCLRWEIANSVLCRAAESRTPQQRLAADMINRFPYMPLDSEILVSAPLRTSDITDLITNTWLSDDHINAGCDFINCHPNRRSNVYTANAYFFITLQHHFQRHSTWTPKHLPMLDVLVSNGSVDELMIPVHFSEHWAVLYISIMNKTYTYCYNCRPDQTVVDSREINPINQWLSILFQQSITLLPGPRPFLLEVQSDNHSCGVATLSTMAHYAIRGYCNPWAQETSHVHRFRWALELSNPINYKFEIDINHVNDGHTVGQSIIPFVTPSPGNATPVETNAFLPNAFANFAEIANPAEIEPMVSKI